MKPLATLLLAILACPAGAECTDAQCNNRLTQRIAPRRLEENVNVNNNVSFSLQLDTALTQVEILRQEVQQLRADLAATKGKDGRDGVDGKPGNDGQNGKDAVTDYAKVWAWLKDHKGEFVGPKGEDGKPAELPNVDAITDAVAKKLPPITFVTRHKDRPSDEAVVYLGKKVDFDPLTVNYIGAGGSIVDTQTVDWNGGELNLHIDVLKK